MEYSWTGVIFGYILLVFCHTVLDLSLTFHLYVFSKSRTPPTPSQKHTHTYTNLIDQGKAIWTSHPILWLILILREQQFAQSVCLSNHWENTPVPSGSIMYLWQTIKWGDNMTMCRKIDDKSYTCRLHNHCSHQVWDVTAYMYYMPEIFRDKPIVAM